MRKALCLAALVMISSSAIAQPAQVSLPNTPAATVRPQILEKMLNLGFRLAAESPSLMTFEKPANNFGAMFLFGTRMAGVPVSRITFMIAELPGSTRVVADMAIIGNPGTGFERRNDINYGSDRDQAQMLLNGLSAAPQPAAAPPPEARVLYPSAN